MGVVPDLILFSVRRGSAVIGMPDSQFGMLICEGDILTASENGYGKRTPVAEFPRKGRGTQGVIAMQTSERNGDLVGAIQLTEQHEILLISDQGTLVRTRAAEVSQVGRNTQGVTLMRVAEDEKLIAVERVDVLEAEADEGDAATEPSQPQPEA